MLGWTTATKLNWKNNDFDKWFHKVHEPIIDYSKQESDVIGWEFQLTLPQCNGYSFDKKPTNLKFLHPYFKMSMENKEYSLV